MKTQIVLVKNDEDSADIYFGDRFGSEMEPGWYVSMWTFELLPESYKNVFQSKSEYQGPFPTPEAALAFIS